MSNYPDPVDSSTVLPGEDCPEMSELKPCPFCGSDQAFATGGFDFVWNVYCPNCNCRGPFFDDDELSAINAWNRRAV